MKESNEVRIWVAGDVFTTTFWGIPEVCIIKNIFDGDVYFIRLESIRNKETLKKDWCLAGLQLEYFKKINKTFLHHSDWYIEYRSKN